MNKFKLTKKDKSLILFIIAILVMIWGIYSFFSYLFFAATFSSSDVNKLVKEKSHWFNLSRPLEITDLKNRIILLDFWTYACVNCIQSLPEIKKLEEEFGNKLTVIGVHSGKFSNEKDSSAIKKAILRHDITHPVINDADFAIWKGFEVNSWPSFVLLNPNGYIVKKYIGEDGAKKIRTDVKKLISKFKYQINRDPLPTALEKYGLIGNVLNFPTKLEYSSNFPYKSRQIPVVFIANSGQHNIIISSLNGEIIAKIGSEKAGLVDGSFDSAAFNAPHGLLYLEGKLYVADTDNHALRLVDFKTGQVISLVGSGRRGEVLKEQIEAKDFDLASPTDLKFFPDKNHIAIANSGTHQILSYDLKNQTISVLAGNGLEGIEDGKYPVNSLAQTAAMSVYDGKLYFIDSETSSLRFIDKSGNVETLIGKGLFDFGYKNGNKSEALMQHPLGLLVDDTAAYIVDSFNHKIRKYDFSTRQIQDFAGSKKRGENLGSPNVTEFNEPEGIIAVLNSFYVADTNNNRIIAIDRGNRNSELFDVRPPLKLPKEGFLQYLPNLQERETVMVKSNSEIALKINMVKGWKINELGPSFINLLEIVEENQANLVKSFDWHSIKSQKITLPKLNADKNYVLQGVIYYCKDKKNALCYIKSYEQKIVADNEENALEIEIVLGE